MTYRLELEDTAEDDLARLDKTVAQQVLDRFVKHRSEIYRTG